jgi:Transposase IS116/IS110/IS902 family
VPVGQPAAQGAGRHRDQARLRRDRHPRQVRAGDARRAGVRDDRPGDSRRPRQGKLRKKIPALKEALEGRFDHLHAVWIGAILAHLDFLDEQISNLTEAIGEQIAPFEKAVELLCTIPGIQRRNAECIIAEIGLDMQVFPTDKQLASWAGQCPGNNQSSGRRRSRKTRKGSKWLDWALEETAMAAIRTNDCYLAALYARLRPRRGHKKALGAVKHSIICIIWHMLSTGELYNDSAATTSATRPRTNHQTTHRPTREPRPQSDPRGVAAGSLNVNSHATPTGPRPQRDFPVSTRAATCSSPARCRAHRVDRRVPVRRRMQGRRRGVQNRQDAWAGFGVLGGEIGRQAGSRRDRCRPTFVVALVSGEVSV